MGSQQGQRPALGATFYPGGSDDFYVPEVISPSPQRCVLWHALVLTRNVRSTSTTDANWL